MIHTVSLETAKLLKEAEFRQVTYFSHWQDGRGAWNLQFPSNKLPDGFDYISAPTTDELLKELPYALRYLESDYWLWIDKLKHDGYDVRYTDASHTNPKKITQHDLLSEALAEMWLWCKKEKLL